MYFISFLKFFMLTASVVTTKIKVIIKDIFLTENFSYNAPLTYFKI